MGRDLERIWEELGSGKNMTNILHKNIKNKLIQKSIWRIILKKLKY